MVLSGSFLFYAVKEQQSKTASILDGLIRILNFDLC